MESFDNFCLNHHQYFLAQYAIANIPDSLSKLAQCVLCLEKNFCALIYVSFLKFLVNRGVMEGAGGGSIPLLQ